MSNYTFIGMGPSSLIAAFVLSRSGHAVTIIDNGHMAEERVCIKNCKKCKLRACASVFGEGGAGTKSDVKLLFSPHSGGDLYALGDKELIDTCIEYVRKFFI